MTLEDLVFKWERPDGTFAHGGIVIRGEGVLVTPIDDDNPLTVHEYCLLTTVAAVYMAAHLKGILPERKDVVSYGQSLYLELVSGNYEGFKAIEDMSLKEFNEEMKKYNGRADEE